MKARALAILLLIPTAAHAQKKWTDIGTTAAGNHVFVDPKSVKRTGNLVAATVRVVFTTPVQTAKGTFWTLTFSRMAELRERLRRAEAPDAQAPGMTSVLSNSRPARSIASVRTSVDR